MVRAIITWSLHNRLIVILGTILLIAVGLYSAWDLNVEAYPDPTPPLVEVIAQNSGASPEEMERLVATPIEIALNGMPGLEDLRSTNLAGLTDVKCQFTYETDYWKARQEVINRINALKNLPPNVTPELSPWSPTGEIVRYVLAGPNDTLNELKAVQDWVLNRQLKTVPGVIDVTGYGGTVKQYQVLVDPQELTQYGITLQQVEDAISNSNANVGGDVLTLGNQSHNVRAIGRALLFSTTIIVCAFIPLFSMTGPEGALFGPMANTYAFAIGGALFLAVTLAPVLCSFLFRNKKEASDTFLDKMMKLRYLKMLSIVLRHRGLTLAIMGSLFLWTLTLLPKLGGEFMPPLEEGYLWIRAILPRTVSLEDAAQMAPRLREVIASVPEVRGVMSHLGRPDDGTDVTGFFNIEIGAPLKPMEQWRTKPVRLSGRALWRRTITREDIELEMMEKFREFPSINFNFSQYIRDNVEEALSGVKGANSVKIFGNGRRAPGQLPQSDARAGLFGLGDLHARTGTPGPAGRHDLPDRGAGGSCPRRWRPRSGRRRRSPWPSSWSGR